MCNVQSRKNVVVHCIYVHLILWNDINKFPQICIKMQYFAFEQNKGDFHDTCREMICTHCDLLISNPGCLLAAGPHWNDEEWNQWQ